jgi:hypothetical protein
VAFLEAKATRKQALIEEARIRKATTEESKDKRKQEKLKRMQKAKERAEERTTNKHEKDY